MDQEHEDTPMFGRTGITSPMGKCTATIPVHLPEALKDKANYEAAKLGTSAGEMCRELIHLWLEGTLYSEHVANSRRSALLGEEPEKRLAVLQKLRVVGEVK